ncbi:MAG: HAD hydrolase-like protein [Gammaproteobacteria bacterium]|nr:HAD hydrolase-like protein [Gammaproteobacteria bacterium]
MLERHGYTPIAIDEYWEKKRDLLNRRDLLELSGAGKIYGVFLEDWLTMIEMPEMLALDKVQDGALECLRNWKRQGVALTLVTLRKNKSGLEAQLVATGLRPCLDAVFVCDHAEGGEGKAAAVRNLCSDGGSIRNTVWVGDTEADWAAARLLGCAVILVSNGLRSESYLKSLGGALVKPSIRELKDLIHAA